MLRGSLIERLKPFTSQVVPVRDLPVNFLFSGARATYATNDTWILCVPGVLAGSNPMLAERCRQAFLKSRQSGESVTITMRSLRGLICRCPDCSRPGTAKMVECPECEGDGQVHWDSRHHEYHATCDTCDGEGKILAGNGIQERESCPTCKGKGYTRDEDKYTLDIGPSHINPEYARRLIKAFGPLTFTIPEDVFKPVYFRFAEGDGIIMSVLF